jgi:hypothetical protein
MVMVHGPIWLSSYSFIHFLSLVVIWTFWRGRHCFHSVLWHLVSGLWYLFGHFQACQAIHTWFTAEKTLPLSWMGSFAISLHRLNHCNLLFFGACSKWNGHVDTTNGHGQISLCSSILCLWWLEHSGVETESIFWLDISIIKLLVGYCS